VQKNKAIHSITQAQKVFEAPIVTELSSAPEFFTAEAYHQNYYNEHPTQGYCYAVISPKIEKFMKVFGDKTKN
jgi:peptide methionine sulfoxide reductase MsrA